MTILHVTLLITTIISVLTMIILSNKYDKRKVRDYADVKYLSKVDKFITISMYVFVLSLCGLIIIQFSE